MVAPGDRLCAVLQDFIWEIRVREQLATKHDGIGVAFFNCPSCLFWLVCVAQQQRGIGESSSEDLWLAVCQHGAGQIGRASCREAGERPAVAEAGTDRRV